MNFHSPVGKIERRVAMQALVSSTAFIPLLDSSTSSSYPSDSLISYYYVLSISNFNFCCHKLKDMSTQDPTHEPNLLLTPQTMPTTSWQDIAAGKQKQRSQGSPRNGEYLQTSCPAKGPLDVQDWPHSSGFFTTEELAITESTALEVQKISRGEWKAQIVMETICKRASVAQQLVNCMTEIFFDEAIQRAKELDAYFEKEGKTVGPLHGLPISFKDQFNLVGVDTSVGYISWANKPASEDSTLVTLLCNAGAIPYVKTNVPATLMMGESVNNVFSRTSNPRNRELTPGGSSGGQSALASFRGSFLGVGTDIGGSIRHPCSFTGLYGLRPSHGRVSY